MPNVINATSTGNGGLITQGDDSGILNIQTNETTAITVDASQNTTFAGKVTSAGALTLASNGTTTAVTIDTSQRTGFGTTSPASYGGTAFVKTVNIGSLNTISAGFSDEVTGTFRIAHASGQNILNFDTSALCFQSGGSTPTERMRITSGGDVLVSTARSTARALVDIPTSGGSAGVPLAVSRGGDGGTMVNFYSMSSTTTVIGSIGNSSNTNTTYNTSSDYRLKDEVTPMSDALDKVSALKPVTWKWKSTGEDGQGFIAHELAQVIPDCVTGEKDAVDADGNPIYQGVDTSYLVATLTAAIQELKAINDTQAETINALTARIVALEGK